jgi:hypothetical protein
MTAQQPEPPDLPELESEIDESEIRRELLNDVSSHSLTRERERERPGRVAAGGGLLGAGSSFFLFCFVFKGPRQCLLVLLVKVEVKLSP